MIEVQGAAMRFNPVLLFGLIAFSSLCAADSFIGDWKLNLTKSELGDNYRATGGRSSYDVIEGGGYLYTSDTRFADGPSILLVGPFKFDGIATDGTLDGHPLRCMAKRLDGTAFEV